MPGGRPKLGDDVVRMRSELGERLRQARVNANLTIDDIAEILGVDARRVSEWERGERGIYLESFVVFAKLCGVTAAHILGEQRLILTSAA